jgi:hypothetical protein
MSRRATWIVGVGFCVVFWVGVAVLFVLYLDG